MTWSQDRCGRSGKKRLQHLVELMKWQGSASFELVAAATLQLPFTVELGKEKGGPSHGEPRLFRKRPRIERTMLAHE